MTIYTVGHSNRSLEELLEVLQSASIATVADIRRFPGSRRNPHFSRDALERSLPLHAIAYAHLEQLGGHRKPRRDSIHEGLRNESFRAYADHMSSEEFARGIERLSELDHPVAVMCAEAVPWRCHRNLLSDWLVLHGHSVVHLISPTSQSHHQPLDISRIRDGNVIYPAPEPDQRELPFGAD